MMHNTYKPYTGQNNPYLVSLVTILLLFPISIAAQIHDIKISPANQKSDIENYYHVLKKRHIGLYRYTSKKEFDYFIDSIKNNISDSCYQRDFFKTICTINSKIHCGHTKTFYPDTTLINKESFIPFSIFNSDTKYYVNSNKTFPHLPIDYKEIVSINNMTIDSIIDEIEKYYYADGHIETRKRIFTMNIFPIYYAWYIDDHPIHQVVFSDSINELDTLFLKSVDYETLTRQLNEGKSQTKDELIQYYSDTLDDYIYIGIESFYSDPEDFCPYLDSIFHKIRVSSCNNLIIDLRGNNGGKILNEYHLMSYLISKKLKSPFKRFLLDGKFKQRKYKREYIEPQDYQFTGNIYFLMDGYTFSAASEFLSIARYLYLGTFIGEETGGAANGCNYGTYKYKLPNSEIICNIPYDKSVFVKPLKNKGRGIFPDHLIIYTKEDYKNKTDKYMLKAIELITNNNKTGSSCKLPK